MVDDLEATRGALQAMLSQAGMDVVAVKSGPDAMDHLNRRLAHGTPFSLAVIDADLPAAVADTTLAENVRQDHVYRDTAVRGLTSAGHHRLVARNKNDQSISWARKPVTESVLWSEAIAAIDRKSPGKPQTRPDYPLPQGMRPLKVLLAEDHPVSARLTSGFLEKRGQRVHAVENGVAAIQALDGETFDLVLMDLEMPEMDGFQLIHRMQLDPAMKETPVVICTTLRDIEAVRRSAELGCRYYVVKPLVGAELVKKVLEAMATGTQIIHTKKAVMDQLELVAMAYDDIIYTSQKIVEQKVFLVEGMLAGRESESTFIELSDLKESGSMLGADRLMESLEPLHDAAGRRVVEVDREDFRALLREMTSLQKALRPAGRVNVVI